MRESTAMTRVKPQLWSISDDVANLSCVKIQGEIHDIHGCFTISHTYQTRKEDGPKTLEFPFFLHDYGLVTGFKVLVAGSEVDARICGKADVPKPAQDLIKRYYDNSATDSFVCRVTDVPSETSVQISISFVQNLHMEGVSRLGLVIPTILAPKHFLSEEKSIQIAPFENPLSNYLLDVDIDVKMTMGEVSTVSSPSHAVVFSPVNGSSKTGKIKLTSLPSNKEVLDVDMVLLIAMKEQIDKLLPVCYVEKHDEDEIVMVSAIPQYKSSFKFNEENEEGHPDPREVLFLLDPHQMTLEEVRMVLSESLSQIDSQIYFNFIILGLDSKQEVFFHKSLQATKATIAKARDILNGELFATKFSEAQVAVNTLASSLKPIYLMDVVSEEIPRILFLISRAHISHPAELIDLVKKNPQPIFSFGLGVDSNYSLLKAISRRSNGECEVVYCEGGEEQARELKYKVSRHIARIIKPEHEDVEINWGDSTQMKIFSQTPSEGLKYIHFNNGDIFHFFALCKAIPKQSWEISLSYKFDQSVEKRKQELRATCDPIANKVTRNRLAIFQMLGELEHPDDSSVRQKKIADKMLKCGAASAYSSFVASEIAGNCQVTLISATDTLEVQNHEKKHVKYSSKLLLQFQPLHTDKPNGVDLGEVEKGSEMKRATRFNTLTRGPVSTRGRNQQSGQTRTKKLVVNVPWDKSKFEEFYKTINSLLNKMSKDNFHTLRDKLLAMKTQIELDVDTLEVIVKLIYEKALFAPRFAPLYADLCSVLAKELVVKFDVPNPANEDLTIQKDFKLCIIDHCKKNFQSCFETPDASTADLSEEDKAEREFKRKSRMGCNITFIGELYIRALLRPMIVHLVIRSLLEEDNEGNLGKPDSQQLELAVKLLTTIEGFKAYQTESEKADRYFDHLLVLSEAEHYDMRIRYLIKDILDLRKKNWEDEKKKKAAAVAHAKANEQKSLKSSAGDQTRSPGGYNRRDDNRGGRDNRGGGQNRRDDRNDNQRRDDRGPRRDGPKEGAGSFFDRQGSGNNNAGFFDRTGSGGRDRQGNNNNTNNNNRDGRTAGNGPRGGGVNSPSGGRNQPQQQPEQPKEVDGFQTRGGKAKVVNTRPGNFSRGDEKPQNPHQQPTSQPSQPTKKPWDRTPEPTVQNSTTNTFAQLMNQQSPVKQQPGKPQAQAQGQQGKQQPQGKPQQPQQPTQPGKPQAQTQQQPTQQPAQVEIPKERTLKIPQDSLNKRAGNMLSEYMEEQSIPEAIEYIQEIMKDAGDIGHVFAAVLLKSYQYRKPKEQELSTKLISHILTEKTDFLTDSDLLFALCIAAPASDEMSEDFPKVVCAFGASLAEMVKLGRLPVENLSVILKDSVDSGFALKTILETANFILQQENGSATVEKIEFGSFFTNRKNFESLASKYPSLKDILAKF